MLHSVTFEPFRSIRTIGARRRVTLAAWVRKSTAPGIAVPHRCCLTDLSSGGCYLEVALPFPQGASLEIVVRTYELKLRLRGTVLASHPGYGMGVAFELNTQEERTT